MTELNGFPWDLIEQQAEDWPAEELQEMMPEHIKLLKDYEQEVMERLLLVRSEIEAAEQYLKTLANGQDK